MHPFTLLRKGPQPVAYKSVAAQAGDLYSPENYIFQRGLAGVLSDQHLVYLQGVSAAEFFRIVSGHTDLQYEFRKHFNSAGQGLSEQQTAAELTLLEHRLLHLIAQRNKDLVEYANEAGQATALLTLSSLTPLAAGAMPKAIVIGTIVTRLWTALTKWSNTPEKHVIVQAFQEMCEQEASELALPQHTSLAIAIPQNEAQVDEGMVKLKDTFMSFPWTEDRHDYLQTLPVNVARNLLRTLEPEDRAIIVNYRTFQEAYIGDYLVYLWNLDERAFWQHVGTMFEAKEGLLLYDDNGLVEIMSSHDMPLSVWKNLLRCLVKVHLKGDDIWGKGIFYEYFSVILAFQTTNAKTSKEKQATLLKWFSRLGKNDQALVLEFLKIVFQGKLPKWWDKKATDRSQKS